jgi:beta-glucosidase
VSARCRELLGKLTLEEKVGLVGGADFWRTHPVPRLGIPALKVTDGPSGARGERFVGGPTSASFPCGAALAATWNVDLALRVGAALAEEARSKSAHVLLGPTVNMHRTPLAGRNFEAYSEDPCLAARIAVAYVRGVQSRGVGACVKHFACNDSEFERMTISSEVPERALREIYLRPFEAAVREAGAWAVMSAYNRVGGTYAGEHPRLLGEILRGEWGFDGFVVSDWFGTHSTVEAANAGLDLEMPGPARFFAQPLALAVRKGEVSEARLDDMALRLLRALERTGALDSPAEPAEQALDRPEHRALAREAAREAIVLLQNRGGVLPFDPARLRSLAVIGPNADVAVIQGGGSAQVTPHYAVSPLEGIRARLGDSVRVRFARGCTRHKTLPALAAGEGVSDLSLEYWNDLAFGGPVVASEGPRSGQLSWFGALPPGVDPRAFSARLRATITPTESGTWTFALQSGGKSRLLVDGRVVVDNWSEQTRGDFLFGTGSAEVRGRAELVPARAHEIAVEYSREGAFMPGLKVGCLPPLPADLLERAVAAASECDAAVVVLGLDAEWETEGNDRADLSLPGRQAELAARVAAANPRTAVVVNAGAPVDLEFAERVPALLWLWYPGQECGNALAEVLFGDANPSGRLPTTFPRRIEDTPAFGNYPGENGAVTYGEGILVGYRWYDARTIEPRFPFGHGLSYSTFAYGPLSLSSAQGRASDALEVALDVTNRGPVAGAEVVQLYVGARSPRLARPPRELAAFEKVPLAPGETKTVRFRLDPRDFACYDPARPGWVVEPGDFEIAAGASSRDLRSRARYVLGA